MSGKVLSFGEIMLRLQPPRHLRFSQGNTFDACFGGGEANVAVALSQLGEQAVFFTKLPRNDIADKCIRELNFWGVDTSRILRGGERIGIYFCEKGASQRPSKVIYDRKHSSINDIVLSEINPDVLLNDVTWFHFTGITPALSQNALTALRCVLRAAKERSITVSCDLNYRKMLWDNEQAKRTMTELMDYTDVVISNEEDCKSVFSLKADNADIDGGSLTAEGYVGLSKRLFSLFPNVKTVAFTLRESISASVNGWSGVICQRNESCVSQRYVVDIVDRIGGGDSYAAGIIFGLKNGYSLKDTVEFAAAASCLKHSVEGDYNITTRAEIESLIKNGGGGRVQR